MPMYRGFAEERGISQSLVRLMFEKFSYMICERSNPGRTNQGGAALKSLVVSLVSTLAKVFVARADARAATLSGQLSNPSLRLTVQTALQMVRTRKRASTSGSAICARGRPQVSACASSRPDDLNFFSFRVAPLGCVNHHQNPRASAGFSATPPASTPQPEGQRATSREPPSIASAARARLLVAQEL